MIRFRHAAIAGVIAAAGLLSACGSGSLSAGQCPKIGVLTDAADLPVTSGGEVVALAQLSLTNGACIYDKSDAERTGFSSVEFPLTVRVAAARLKSSRLSAIDATYIVATISPDGVVTGRQEYSTSISLTERTVFDDQRLIIKVPYEGNGSAGEHRVVVAFKLDRETVELNRSRLGR